MASREWTQIQIQLQLEIQIQIEPGELVSQSVVFIKLRLIIYADFDQWAKRYDDMTTTTTTIYFRLA